MKFFIGGNKIATKRSGQRHVNGVVSRDVMGKSRLRGFLMSATFGATISMPRETKFSRTDSTLAKPMLLLCLRALANS